MKVLHSMKLAAVVFLAASLSVGTADAARREKAEEPKIDYPDATRESPKADWASRWADARVSASSLSRSTTFIPLPPPPAAALSSTG